MKKEPAGEKGDCSLFIQHKKIFYLFIQYSTVQYTFHMRTLSSSINNMYVVQYIIYHLSSIIQTIIFILLFIVFFIIINNQQTKFSKKGSPYMANNNVMGSLYQCTCQVYSLAHQQPAATNEFFTRRLVERLLLQQPPSSNGSKWLNYLNFEK